MWHLQFADWSGAEYRAALRCLVSGQVRRGKAVERLEAALRRFFPAPIALHAVNSGSTALRLTLEAFRQHRPDRLEVIIPAYICPSVPEAVRACGLVPIRAPVGEDLNLTPEAVAAAIGPRTLAVIAAHMYGCPCRIGEIETLCREGEVYLVDDAAQVLGVRRDGRMLGSFGDAGILSFAQSKAIITGVGGSGGILLTAVPELQLELARKVANLPPPPGRLKYFFHFLWNYLWHAWTGQSGYYLGRLLALTGIVLPRPVPGRMANLDAALALAQLARLDSLAREKIRLADLWHEALATTPEATFPQYAPGRFLSRVMLALPESADTASVRQRMADLGVETRVAYPPQSGPNGEGKAWAGRLLEVPAGSGMTKVDVDEMCHALSRALANQG